MRQNPGQGSRSQSIRHRMESKLRMAMAMASGLVPNSLRAYLPTRTLDDGEDYRRCSHPPAERKKQHDGHNPEYISLCLQPRLAPLASSNLTQDDPLPSPLSPNISIFPDQGPAPTTARRMRAGFLGNLLTAIFSVNPAHSHHHHRHLRDEDDDEDSHWTNRPIGRATTPAKFKPSLICLSSLLLIIILFGLSIYYTTTSHSSAITPTTSTKIRLDHYHPPSLHDDLQDECDPFSKDGYLNFDDSDPLNNTWVPFDQADDCQPENNLQTLIHDLQSIYASSAGNNHEKLKFKNFDHHLNYLKNLKGLDNQLSLPWLINRTVVLIGDSIERFHARDFCDLVTYMTDRKKYHNISTNGFSESKSNYQTPSVSYFLKPLSASTSNNDQADKKNNDFNFLNYTEQEKLKNRWYFNPSNHNDIPPDWPSDQHQYYLDHHIQWADRENIRTSPWICEVPSYGFRIVTLFGFGVEPYKSGWHYSKEDWYISPSSFIDKLKYTLQPILRKLADERGLRKISEEPDLIEVCSGLWDLRQWSEEDSRLNKVKLEDSNDLFFLPLSIDRLNWWKERVIKLLISIDQMFNRPDDQQQEQAEIDLHNKNKTKTQSSFESTILWRSLHHPVRHAVAPYSRVEQLNQFSNFMIKDLIRNHQHQHQNLSRLANRLKIDTWGQKMLGQENHFRDSVHPKALPGSVLWSEMMLWHLKSSIIRKEKGKLTSDHQVKINK